MAALTVERLVSGADGALEAFGRIRGRRNDRGDAGLGTPGSAVAGLDRLLVSAAVVALRVMGAIEGLLARVREEVDFGCERLCAGAGAKKTCHWDTATRKQVIPDDFDILGLLLVETVAPLSTVPC